MSYRVVFEFSPLYELVNSLELFLFKKSIKNADLGPEWIKAVQEKLDAQNLDLGNPKDLPCFQYLNLLIWQSPEKENVEAFIKWLHSLEPGSIYEKLFSYVSESLPSNLSAIRDRYVDLIKKWNDIYFSKMDTEILVLLRESVSKWDGKIIARDSIAFVEQVSGGLRIEAYEGLEQVIMTPTFHISPLVSISKFKNIAHILYPVDALVSDPHQPSKKLARITKALADENRLRIIKLLKEGPKTFTEILKHFDVSKSTVHHHVMLLRTAGLISAYHTNECCSETFVYRPNGMKELTEQFNEYIEK
ncbi:ArsR/SmtB family transcription factor [Bacillus sp. CGMCC 1.16607]|uniref:ArsR/SmtB family transcription factor n=1 Tax=Bacillus sp. CGMCC 1.16607 TaxID=3351842 RepID=UPI00363DE400